MLLDNVSKWYFLHREQNCKLLNSNLFAVLDLWYFMGIKCLIAQNVWSLCNPGTGNKIFNPKDLNGWY